MQVDSGLSVQQNNYVKEMLSLGAGTKWLARYLQSLSHSACSASDRYFSSKSSAKKPAAQSSSCGRGTWSVVPLSPKVQRVVRHALLRREVPAQITALISPQKVDAMVQRLDLNDHSATNMYCIGSRGAPEDGPVLR